MNTPLKARPASELNAESLYQELLQQMRVIVAKADSPVRLVGIASGGVWLAHRLQADLGLEGSAGVVSSSMHRDDFSTRGLSSMSVQTQLPFEVNGAKVPLLPTLNPDYLLKQPINKREAWHDLLLLKHHLSENKVLTP